MTFLKFLQYEEFFAYLIMTNRVLVSPKGQKGDVYERRLSVPCVAASIRVWWIGDGLSEV
jgi:hypothetical protein